MSAICAPGGVVVHHPVGTTYLLHFERVLGNTENPRGMARHYIGWADDVDARLADHRAGRGARLLAACVREGIGWEVVRTWPGVARSTERALKNRKQAWSLCPVCLLERRGGIDTGTTDGYADPAGSRR